MTVPLLGTARPAGRARGGLGRVVPVVLVVLVLVLLLAPGLLSRTGPVDTTDAFLSPPSAEHWFGTDQLGRDVFSRTVFGARPVLLASLLGVLVAVVAGVALGVLAGAAPRWLNAVLMRAVDVLLALPVLLIALILIATAGSGVRSIVIALGVAFTPGFARVVEASVRRLRTAEYVQAAHVFGSTGLRTAVRHLLPNLMTEVVVLASSAVGWAVLTASTLSFLGLGVQLPQPDWGSDLAAGATSLATSWWLATFPGLAVTITILLANFTGDQLMSALDPRDGLRLRQSMPRLLGRRPAGPAEPGRSTGPVTTNRDGAVG
ncbi:peptide/nickel transport system permease protein [Microlunatus flavus]|uniref:Peptide/nickel transport system permease protein n=1 Tax=Microlunatus flavus TaxID=1036181 RepID=A0A1H9N180_9ACTN|nr:ABC transporter permease [Microlunatus flavus]SER29692.1 peptide/nickel transport system permease protein [Microlunatus flavus]